MDAKAQAKKVFDVYRSCTKPAKRIGGVRKCVSKAGKVFEVEECLMRRSKRAAGSILRHLKSSIYFKFAGYN